jgi:hypothetical protein
MKKRYLITYKIKKDYPEIDEEDCLEISATNQLEALKMAINEIKRTYIDIEKFYTDDEIAMMLYIEEDTKTSPVNP